MTKRTRYFVFGSVTVLLVGLCTGLVAYYTGMPMGAFGQSSWPVGAALRAGQRVGRGVRRRAQPDAVGAAAEAAQGHRRRGRGRPGRVPEANRHRHRKRHRPRRGVHGADARRRGLHRAWSLATGRFDQGRLEALAREHGGSVEDYGGKRLISKADIETDERRPQEHDRGVSRDRRRRASARPRSSSAPSTVRAPAASPTTPS